MDTKRCITCGNLFNRPLVNHGGGKEYPLSITLWKRRKYCSNKCSVRVGSKNERHPLWKGEGVSYSALHRWIKRNLGVPEKCTMCGMADNGCSDGRRYVQWASTDHSYSRNTNNWTALCCLCHSAYDRQNELRYYANH